MRTMLSRSIIVLFVAGLLAVVYVTQPDVPVGSASSRARPPSARAPLPIVATKPPIPTGPESPVSNDLVANTAKPNPLDTKAPGANARLLALFFLLVGDHRPRLP
jgi:hypothetical protein